MAKIKNTSSAKNKFSQIFIRFGIGLFVLILAFFWIYEITNTTNLSTKYTLSEKQKRELENLRPDTVTFTPKITEDVLYNLGYTLGFKYGKNYTISKIKTKFPSLNARIIKANSRFELKFGDSFAYIDSILFNNSSNEFQSRKNFKETIKEQLDNYGEYVDYQFSLNYLKNLENNTESFTDSLALKTLLIFHPDFINNPENEFLKGFKQRFIAQSHPKSKGLKFHIDFPKSWLAKEASRPNIVQTLKSENGRGDVMCMVTVKNLGIDITNNFSKEIFQSLKKADLIEILSKLEGEAYFIDGGFVQIDKINGLLIEFYKHEINELAEIWIRFKAYNLFYQEKLIQIQCGTGVSEKKAYSLDTNFNRFDKLFSLIAHSFVLDTKWMN